MTFTAWTRYPAVFSSAFPPAFPCRHRLPASRSSAGVCPRPHLKAQVRWGGEMLGICVVTVYEADIRFVFLTHLGPVVFFRYAQRKSRILLAFSWSCTSCSRISAVRIRREIERSIRDSFPEGFSTGGRPLRIPSSRSTRSSRVYLARAPANLGIRNPALDAVTRLISSASFALLVHGTSSNSRTRVWRASLPLVKS